MKCHRNHFLGFFSGLSLATNYLFGADLVCKTSDLKNKVLIASERYDKPLQR